MLRKTLIGLGLFVALLPYLGFPHAWQTVMLTIAGLLIVFLLSLSRKPRVLREEFCKETPQVLRVEHQRKEEPQVYGEAMSAADKGQGVGMTHDQMLPTGELTAVQKRRRSKPVAVPAVPSATEGNT